MPLDDLTVLGEEGDLAFPLVDIDANMVHGWPLPSAALTAGCSCGAAYATTSSERPAASSHLSSWPKRKGGMPRGKRLLEDAPDIPLQDVWTDIKIMHNLAAERLGYPTQKPQELLERIISASSNEGQVVLDPFCGC